MEQLQNYIQNLFGNNPAFRWIAMLLTIIVLFFISRIIRRIIKKFSQKNRLAEKIIFASFLNAISRSVTFLLLAIGLLIGREILIIPENLVKSLDIAANILITVTIGVILYNLVEVPSKWFETLVEKTESGVSKMFIPVFRKTLGIIVIALVVLQIVVIVLDKSATSIVAGLGIGGLAVALAAQDSLRHFIGSFVIASDKPFEIGDRIVIDGFDGPVESIGLRSTRIRTLEGHLVSIPNGELANKTIQNIGKRPHIRRLSHITITYDTPPEKIQRAIDILNDILKDHEGMDPELPPRVYFNELNADSLNIRMIYWYHPAHYWEYMDFSQKVNMQIMQRFNDEGIDFAFPTQTLHLAGDPNRPLNVGIDKK